MDPRVQATVERLFHAAADLPTTQRVALLDAECAGDPSLRRLVEGLLRADTMHAAGSARLGGAAVPDLIGAEVGPYRVESLIGEGGFGAVYLAEQQRPLRRRVALKVIKAGMDTRQVVARFEAERQVLALMEHPNIARVLDAGATPRGQPYFAMEHVPGVPLTRFCDEQRLGIDQRLALFLEVCGAIHHAHQKGVIHRDIKPSNILVEVLDGRPIPKVIDFGIAKATSGAAAADGPRTEHGGVLGTPEYMSPEQAEMGGTDVDTRADVYSLGVVLYELLTGVPPIDPVALRRGSPADLARRLRDLPAVRPSTRLRLLATPRTGATARAAAREEPTPPPPPDPRQIAARRACDVPTLRRRLRGDLDWILLKAMEKDRARRYASVSEFAADIERHRRGEAVLAGPPSASYRARKFIRRNRAAAAGAAVVLLALVGSSLVSTLFAIREAAQHARAERVTYRAAIAAASAALERGDEAGAVRHLDDAPAAHRGWEWRHLRWQADRSVRAVDTGEPVHAAAVASGALRAVTVGASGRVRVWDLGSCAEVAVVDLHPDPAVEHNRLKISADGALVAAAEQGGVVGVCDAASGRRLWAHPGPAALVGFLEGDDAEVAIEALGPRRVVVLEGRTGRELRSTPLPEVYFGNLEITPDGGRIAYSPRDGELVTIDSLSAGEVRRFAGYALYWIDGREYGYLRDDMALCIASDAPLTMRATPVRVGRWDRVAVERRRGLVAIASGPRQVAIADAATGSILTTIGQGTCMPPQTSVEGLLCLASGSRLSMWDWECCAAATRPVFPAWCAAVLPDASAVLCGGWGTVWCLDAATGAVRWTTFPTRHHTVAVCPLQGWGVVAIDERGRAFLLDPQTGARRAESALLEGRPTKKCRHSPREDALYVVPGTGAPVRWGLSESSGFGAVEELGWLAGVRDVAVSADGRRAAAVGVAADGRAATLWVWDAGADPQRRRFALPYSEPMLAAVSGDGAQVAVAGADQLVRLHDARNGALIHALSGADFDLASLCFSPDGERIVAGDQEGRVHLWRTRDGLHVASLKADAPESSVFDMAFTPDGRTLVAAPEGAHATALETGAPAGGFGSRSTASRGAALAHLKRPEANTTEGWLAAVRAAPDVPGAVAREAGRTIRAQRIPPNALNSSAWATARAEGRSQTEYQTAVRMASEALESFPGDWAFLNTLGVAQQRAGQNAEAIRSLLASEEAGARRGVPSQPANWAFIAMAHHALGDSAAAAESLAKAAAHCATPPPTCSRPPRTSGSSTRPPP